MLSQTTEYALRAMCCLALSPGIPTPTSDLAERTRVSMAYLSKVLRLLADARLVTARRGVGGGYILARPAREIRLTDVVRAVGRLHRITTCPLGLTLHGSALCPLHRVMDQAVAAVDSLLAGRTLQEIVDQPGANVPLCDSMQASVSARGKPGR